MSASPTIAHPLFACRLADELEQVLGRPVDLVSKRALHARLKDAVLTQAQVVYAT